MEHKHFETRNSQSADQLATYKAWGFQHRTAMLQIQVGREEVWNQDLWISSPVP